MEHVKEALKEAGRLVLIAVLSYLLTAGVVDGLIAHVFGTHIDPTIRLQVIAAVTIVLRGVDAWMHEIGRAQGNPSLITGLTRF